MHASDYPLLAPMFSANTALYRDDIEFVEVPGIALERAHPQCAEVIDMGLGILYGNAVKHGATQLRIRYDRNDHHMISINIIDNGPGFDPAVLDDEATMLHALRRKAREVGGDLMMERTTEGTDICLAIPVLPRS